MHVVLKHNTQCTPWAIASIKISLNIVIIIFFCHEPCLFLSYHIFAVPPLNMLDHINALYRPKNMSFRDLEFHGHFDIFSLV